MNEKTDIELIDKSQNGNSDAMETLLNKYRGMVIKESRKLYLIGADEEDLLQEGMIGLFKAVRDYESEANVDFPVFAHICIVRQLYSAVRRDNRGKTSVLNNALSIDSANDVEGSTIADYINAEELSPEDRVIENERIEEIWASIHECLSGYEKNVLELYLAGKKYDEIAEELDKDKKSIDNAIQRIRNKLSDAIGV